MRTRSNPVALMIAMIVGLSVTAVSCSPESTSPLLTVKDVGPGSAQTTPSLQEQYAWTGKYHNDALTYAMSKIKDSNKISKFEKCKVGLAALKDFQKAFRKAGGNAVFDDLTITDGMCEAAESVPNRVVASRGVAASGFRPRADISPLSNDYLNQILYQVDIASSAPSLTYAVSGIVSQASYTVEPLEGAAVATSGSIAVNSADYWVAVEGTATDAGPAPYVRTSNQAIGTGDDLLSPKFIAGLSPRAKYIIKADVAAAVGVLLREWFMGEAAVAKACIAAAAASLVAGVYFS